MKKFLFSGIIACLIGFCLSCTTTEDSAGLQMRAGLPNFNYKIQKNEPVSVVFLGGSITNHQGYRVQITDWLKQQYSNVQFTSINSGLVDRIRFGGVPYRTGRVAVSSGFGICRICCE